MLKEIKVQSLRDTEQRILSYMLISNTNFRGIKKRLSVEDFTFKVHKTIFLSLSALSKLTLEDEDISSSQLEVFLKSFSKVTWMMHDLKKSTTLHVLTQPYSQDIDRDIQITKEYSLEKELVLCDNYIRVDGSIETDEGLVASIHKVSATLLKKQSNNGWTFWFVKRDNELISIDELRKKYIKNYLNGQEKKTQEKLFKVSEPKVEYEFTTNFLGE